MRRKHRNVLNRIAISRRIAVNKARNVRNTEGHETTSESAHRHDVVQPLYAAIQAGGLRLPDDPVMLSVALAELLSVGYDGYLYYDDKFKKPAGKVRDILKQIPLNQ